MQVYDLDKTQEWLNRTMAIRKEPPMRGGVKTDHRLRRQTAIGVAVVALFLLALVSLPVQRCLVAAAAMKVDQEPTPVKAIDPTPLPAANGPAREKFIVTTAREPYLRPTVRRPQYKWASMERKRGNAPQDTSGKVAPPAPTWLDGK